MGIGNSRKTGKKKKKLFMVLYNFSASKQNARTRQTESRSAKIFSTYYYELPVRQGVLSKGVTLDDPYGLVLRK